MSYRRAPIFFVIALLVAAACTQPPPSGGTSTPQATGGAASTLVWYADTSDLISLDPAVAYEFTGVLLALTFWRTRPGFMKHAFATNTMLMSAGFVLVGAQLSGYFLTAP